MDSLKPILGNAARKDQFFPRPKIRKAILEALELNQNILISSPRRVGKTSVLFNLIDEPDDLYYMVYINTEGIDNSEKFFERILSEIFNQDHLDQFNSFGKEVKHRFKIWGERIAAFKIAGTGIDLRPGEKVSYFDQLREFLTEANLEGRQIVLLLDEFSVTLENILKAENKDAAAFFLNQNRELRQTPGYQHKIRFIYTGSIGLLNVAKRLNATDRVNDLTEVKVGPLKEKEARDFIKLLFNFRLKRQPEEIEITDILQKVGIYFPYYLQLLIKEMAELEADGRLPNQIEEAFKNLIANGNSHLQHYKGRLGNIFEIGHRNFVIKLMLRIKASGGLQRNEILNMAEGEGLRGELDDVLDTLFHDGYLAENQGVITFYSIILENWWK
jgi:AAA+ ATPase superfamily predicted ATPase